MEKVYIFMLMVIHTRDIGLRIKERERVPIGIKKAIFFKKNFCLVVRLGSESFMSILKLQKKNPKLKNLLCE